MRLQKGAANTVKKDAIRKIVQDVSKAFLLCSFSEGTNPFINKKGKLQNLILKMLSSYKIRDLPIRREFLITPSILQIILKLAKSTRDIFIVNLIIGAFFFVIYSYKYVKIISEPRTSIILFNDISFFKIKNK